jgi:uncharacterized protein
MERIELIKTLVKPYYHSTDPAHDWAHICRVARTAEKLCLNQKVNLIYVLATVYCHDLVNIQKDHPDRVNASQLTSKAAAPLLKKAGFNTDEIQFICNAILEHSYSKDLRPSSPEAAIVQDADRLDALGAIGILRCASVNTQMGSSFYDVIDPFSDSRELNDKKFMLDHYYVKLFKLPELMNTPQGKILANQGVEFMKNFINQLKIEIRG